MSQWDVGDVGGTTGALLGNEAVSATLEPIEKPNDKFSGTSDTLRNLVEPVYLSKCDCEFMEKAMKQATRS